MKPVCHLNLFCRESSKASYTDTFFFFPGKKEVNLKESKFIVVKVIIYASLSGTGSIFTPLTLKVVPLWIINYMATLIVAYYKEP